MQAHTHTHTHTSKKPGYHIIDALCIHLKFYKRYICLFKIIYESTKLTNIYFLKIEKRKEENTN